MQSLYNLNNLKSNIHSNRFEVTFLTKKIMIGYIVYSNFVPTNTQNFV